MNEPTVPGWYIYPDGANYLVFLLDEYNQWWVATASGTIEKCVFGYIDQALHEDETLVLVAKLGG